MIYSLLADATIIIHLAFILFVIFGGLFAFWKKWVIPVHVLAATWGILIEFFKWGCPLTPLENYFREQAGMGSYTTGFIEHYLVPIIYPMKLTPSMQFSLGFIVLFLNLFIYGIYVYKRRNK